ncbi:hypothetical protein ACWC2K_10195 [Streptomyces chattanoogensis]
MKKTRRTHHVIACACGVLMALGGATPALAWSGYDWGGSANGDTWIEMDSILVCKDRARICVNGPVNSGNVRNAQNVSLSGTAGHKVGGIHNGTAYTANSASGNTYGSGD